MFTPHSSPMILNFLLTKFPFLLSFCLTMCIHRFFKIPWTIYSLDGLHCGSSPSLYLNVLLCLFPILNFLNLASILLALLTCHKLNTCSDLGINIDDELTFSWHILSSTKKAYKQSSIMYRCFLSKNPHLLKSAFTSYVRPILEYASPIWSPHSTKDIDWCSWESPTPLYSYVSNLIFKFKWPCDDSTFCYSYLQHCLTFGVWNTLY